MLTNRTGKLYNVLQDPDVLFCFCCQKKCKNSILISNLPIDIYHQSLELTEFSPFANDVLSGGVEWLS